MRRAATRLARSLRFARVAPIALPEIARGLSLARARSLCLSHTHTHTRTRARALSVCMNVCMRAAPQLTDEHDGAACLPVCARSCALTFAGTNLLSAAPTAGLTAAAAAAAAAATSPQGSPDGLLLGIETVASTRMQGRRPQPRPGSRTPRRQAAGISSLCTSRRPERLALPVHCQRLRRVSTVFRFP